MSIKRFIAKMLHSRVFWVSVIIAILGGASFWFPFLGIPIAILTIISTCVQGYENMQAEQELKKTQLRAIKHTEILKDLHKISEIHSETLREEMVKNKETIDQLKDIQSQTQVILAQTEKAFQTIERVRREERTLTKWSGRLLLAIYSFCDVVIVPIITKREKK